MPGDHCLKEFSIYPKRRNPLNTLHKLAVLFLCYNNHIGYLLYICLKFYYVSYSKQNNTKYLQSWTINSKNKAGDVRVLMHFKLFFSFFFFSLFYTVSSSPPGMLPLLNEDFFLLCNGTFFFYFRFLKSYLRNFGVAPDSAVLMVIERGKQASTRAAPLQFPSPESRFSHTDSPEDAIKFVFVRAALHYILFFLKWSRVSWKLSQLPKGVG